MSKKFFRSKRAATLSLPERAARVLTAFLILLFLILVRVWHLSVTLHDEKVEEAHRPQRRVVIERAERATIIDRFGIPLAVNKVQYNAAVSYSRIREVPRFVWTKDASGKRVRIFKRTAYIRELSEFLAQILYLDPDHLEDLIHAKASIFGSVPFVIKEDISEQAYFRLKMLEKDWPGIFAERTSQRAYPMGKLAAPIVGYMGAISRKQYDKVTGEMQQLRETLEKWEEGTHSLPHATSSMEAVKRRLKVLEAKAYKLTDRVGKMGVEATFDERLRGERGQRIYLADIFGNYLQELPGGVDAQGGEQVTLSISAELQAFAEQLLVEYEANDPPNKNLYPPKHPWVKGGAIVAIDPNTAEVLALASTPRFDPSDFVRSGNDEQKRQKQTNVMRWLENESYLKLLWEQKEPLKRERFSILKGDYIEDNLYITWENYLDFLLPEESRVRDALNQLGKLKDLYELQRTLKALFSVFLHEDQHHYPWAARLIDFLYPSHQTGVQISLQEREIFENSAFENQEKIEELKTLLSPLFSKLPLNRDKLLVADLSRLVLDSSRFDSTLISLVGEQSVSEFMQTQAYFVSCEEALRNIVQELFHEYHFKKWREAEFKTFLAKKREEETARKRYARPYIEYLLIEEKRQFSTFWQKYKLAFLMTFLTAERLENPDLLPYAKNLLAWTREVQAGGHRALDWTRAYLALKEVADEFHPKVLPAYLKTLRHFDDLNAPLLGAYPAMRKSGGRALEKHLAMAFYPIYGFGYTRSCAYSQATSAGSLFKLIPSYAILMQRYKLQQAGKVVDLNPLTIIDDKHVASGSSGKWNVGYRLDGRPIPMFYRGGRLPRTDHYNVGRVDLKRALETSSNPFFSLVVGDHLNDPEDLCDAARLFSFGARTGIDLTSEFQGNIPKDVTYNRTGLYSMAIGQHSLVVTPLQSALMLTALANGGNLYKPQIVKQTEKQGVVTPQPQEVVRQIELPEVVRQILLEGMQSVVLGDHGTARGVRTHRSLSVEERGLAYEVVGKTSTAEVMAVVSLEGATGTQKLKDVGIGIISFEQGSFTKPELVIVVFLRRGHWGNTAAPFAFKMIHKWREILKENKVKKSNL